MPDLVDKRKATRKNTHIAMEMFHPGTGMQSYGFIENICEGGMGVVSLDEFKVGTSISAIFDLPHNGERINPKASVLHTRGKSREGLPVVGFRFDSLNDREKISINKFVWENQ